MVVAAAAHGWSASARSIQIAKRSITGYPYGTVADPDNVTAGTTTSSRKIKDLRTLTHPEKTVARAFNKGDQKVDGQMYLGVDDYGEGSFEIGGEDETFNAMISRSAVDTTIATDMLIAGDNSANVDPPPMFLMASSRWQDTTDGSFWYDNQIYLNVLIRKPRPANISQQAGESPNPLTYNFVPSLATRLITGHLFTASTLAVLENTDTFIKIRSKYPLAITTYKAVGAGTGFTLPYLPKYSGVTGAAQNIVTKNGVTNATAVSISTTTGAVVIPSATLNDIWVVVYQTEFATV